MARGDWMPIGCLVGTIRSLLQSLAIKDTDVSAPRGNETIVLKRIHRISDTGTVGAEHQTEEFVGERQFFAVYAVVGHEKPARQPLFDLAAAVGERSRGCLKKKRVRVGQHRA